MREVTIVARDDDAQLVLSRIREIIANQQRALDNPLLKDLKITKDIKDRQDSFARFAAAIDNSTESNINKEAAAA